MNSLAYNSVWQLRADAWSQPGGGHFATGHAGRPGPPGRALREPVGNLLNLLDPIEQDWGFPGKQRFEQILRLFAEADYDRLAPRWLRLALTDTVSAVRSMAHPRGGAMLGLCLLSVSISLGGTARSTCTTVGVRTAATPLRPW